MTSLEVQTLKTVIADQAVRIHELESQQASLVRVLESWLDNDNIHPAIREEMKAIHAVFKTTHSTR